MDKIRNEYQKQLKTIKAGTQLEADTLEAMQTAGCTVAPRRIGPRLIAAVAACAMICTGILCALRMNPLGIVEPAADETEGIESLPSDTRWEKPDVQIAGGKLIARFSQNCRTAPETAEDSVYYTRVPYHGKNSLRYNFFTLYEWQSFYDIPLAICSQLTSDGLIHFLGPDAYVGFANNYSDSARPDLMVSVIAKMHNSKNLTNVMRLEQPGLETLYAPIRLHSAGLWGHLTVRVPFSTNAAESFELYRAPVEADSCVIEELTSSAGIPYTVAYSKYVKNDTPHWFLCLVYQYDSAAYIYDFNVSGDQLDTVLDAVKQIAETLIIIEPEK